MTSSTNAVFSRDADLWAALGRQSHPCLCGSQQPGICLKHFPHTTQIASSPYFPVCLQFLTASTDTQRVMISFLNVNLTVQDELHALLQWYPDDTTADLMLTLQSRITRQQQPCLSKFNARLKLKNLHRFLLKDRNATNGNLKGFMMLVFKPYFRFWNQFWVVRLVE